MKGNYTIIFSAVIIIILLGILAYLHFFVPEPEEVPGKDDVFSNLEFDTPLGSEEPGVTGNNTGLPDISGSMPKLRLRQLTTRNTIGYAEIVRSTTTPPSVLIGEAGVGHIYEINLEQGTETRVGYTTIPDARSMVFSLDGKTFAVISSELGGTGRLQLGVLDSAGAAALTTVADNVTGMKMIDGVLLYSTEHNTGVDVISRTLSSGTERTLFTVPFRDAIIVFGANLSGPHLAYPKSSQHLEGFVYSYTSGSRTRTPLDGFGLTAQIAGNEIVSTWRNGSEATSVRYSNQDTLSLTTPILPEKCTGTADTVVCGHDDNTEIGSKTTDQWYQGGVRFSDTIWLLSDDSLVPLIDIEVESGRGVDLITPTIGKNTNDLYFKNKIDQTLWWYDLSEDIRPNDN